MQKVGVSPSTNTEHNHEGLIHSDFPSRGSEQRAHMGSQSVPAHQGPMAAHGFGGNC
jgi:hypothetical protein